MKIYDAELFKKIKELRLDEKLESYRVANVAITENMHERSSQLITCYALYRLTGCLLRDRKRKTTMQSATPR